MMNREPMSWDRIKRRVYWDRDVSLEKWQEFTAAAHPSFLPAAVYRMHVLDFIHYYGAKQFVQDWPRLREKLPLKEQKRAGWYDAVWSHLVSHSKNLFPVSDFWDMPRIRRDVMIAAAKEPGMNIDELADKLDVNATKLEAHVKELMDQGKLRNFSPTGVATLYPMSAKQNSLVHKKLLGLDDVQQKRVVHHT
ncbi:winged helix-turn-helix domain-containing protein [Paraburkholderia tropica]|uniref:winged helix-turn-helix domain-containing protein n=1 Tax=Paraburkholderia tropica TaxID=92647 RepID=UPI003D2A4A75